MDEQQEIIENVNIKQNVEITDEMINNALAELEELKSSYSTKRYNIRGGRNYATSLKKWLTNDAKWNYSEAYAVVKLTESVDYGITLLNEKKESEFTLLNVELSALNVLFQKVEGKGYHSAKLFRDIMMPVIDVLSTEVKADSDKIDRLDFKITSWKEGIQPAPEVDLTGDEIEEPAAGV